MASDTSPQPARPTIVAADDGTAWWGKERWLFLAGCLSLIAVLVARPLGDFDLPWHLATGRDIVAHGRVPTIDPLAFTHGHLNYVDVLADVPLYGLWRIGGAFALQLSGALVCGAIAGLLAWQGRRQGPSCYATAALGVAGMSAWLVVRPATLSFLLLGVETALLERHRRVPDDRAGRAALYATPPMLLAWANTHGFASLGGVVIVGYALYRLSARVISGRLWGLFPREDGRDAGRTLAVACVGLVCACANVIGPGFKIPLLRVGHSADSAFLTRAVTEFEPASLGFFKQHEPLGLLIGAIAVVALMFGANKEGRWSVPTAFEIAVGLAGLAALSLVVRTIPIGVLLLAPLAGRRLGPRIPPTPLARWACAASIWLAAGYCFHHTTPHPSIGFDAAAFPLGATRWIEQNQPRGPMWNSSHFGGYLALRMLPARPVFMDGRNTYARSADLVRQAYFSNFDPAVLISLARRFDMQYAVVSAREGEQLGAPLSHDRSWVMVYVDDAAAVYVRARGANEPLARSGYRLLRHLNPPPQVLRFALRGVRAADLGHDGDLALAQAPNSPRAAFLASCGAVARRDGPALGRHLQRLEARLPNHPVIPYLRKLAVALQTTGTID